MQNYSVLLLKTLVVSIFLSLCGFSDAFAAEVNLAWDPSPDASVIGYKVYYGDASGQYQWVKDARANFSYTVTGLSEPEPYYFAVTAYSDSEESGYSKELACYFIVGAASANGQIKPVGVNVYSGGSSQTFSILPDNGYKISQVLIDGASAGPISQYTFHDLNACHTITANFAPINYVIDTQVQGNGSISPSGPVDVSPGANQAFTISPAANYQISDVYVDGVSVGAIPNYTFKNIITNHTIKATFIPIPNYIIISTAGSYGFLSPSGAVSVKSGASQKFTIIPTSGYKTASVKVDGVSIGTPTTYTFSNINANHTISASFVIIGPNGGRTASVASNASSNASSNAGNAANVPAISPPVWALLAGLGLGAILKRRKN
jgi:hypothetical protein